MHCIDYGSLYSLASRFITSGVARQNGASNANTKVSLHTSFASYTVSVDFFPVLLMLFTLPYVLLNLFILLYKSFHLSFITHFPDILKPLEYILFYSYRDIFASTCDAYVYFFIANLFN